uniref:Gamma-secretase subunit aph1-like n=1 Tax=Tetraselmis sp. GSL018 TaxID=582737 RepID=A0A061RC53_9CHLO|mmetsp:Transcript_37848/g.89883  ORF Transcript_37848/g.89883 Transcript_37848/m.89883 type:complete len:280 (-) Transcript_37848:1506-2345(-)
MGFAYWFGSLLIGVGPGIAIYSSFVGRKSFLVLLSLASAFYWLLSLFLVACIFRGFVPLPLSVGPYAALLLVSVFAQEGLRLVLYWINRRVVSAVNRLAHTMDMPMLSELDEREISLSYGMGHGFSHSIFFFVSFLQLALGDGTYYAETCPGLSFFLVSALNSLAFLLLHSFGMVVSFDGMRRKQRYYAAFTPAVHLSAALLTLGNLSRGGCVVVAPLVMALSLTPAAVAARTSWAIAAQSPRSYLVGQAEPGGAEPAADAGSMSEVPLNGPPGPPGAS